MHALYAPDAGGLDVETDSLISAPDPAVEVGGRFAVQAMPRAAAEWPRWWQAELALAWLRRPTISTFGLSAGRLDPTCGHCSPRLRPDPGCCVRAVAGEDHLNMSAVVEVRLNVQPGASWLAVASSPLVSPGTGSSSTRCARSAPPA